MRTTLDIDEDVLALAKELAAKERRTTGSLLSSLARQGYHAKRTFEDTTPPVIRKRNGIRMLPRRQEPVTLAHVQKLLDEEGA